MSFPLILTILALDRKRKPAHRSTITCSLSHGISAAEIMSDTPQSPSKHQAWRCVLGTLAFIFLAQCAIYTWQHLASEKVPAIASATFANGFKVEIIRAELTTKLTHQPSRFIIWSPLTESISFAHSFMLFSTKEVNGSLSEASIEHQTHQRGLYLLLRAFLPDGTAFTSDHFIADEGKNLIKIQRQGTRMTGGQKIPSGHALEQCGLLMEVEDGADGWLPFAGPIFADTKDAHALASRSPFPRTNPTLRIRFQTPGQAPVVASIPNPGYASSFTSWKPETLPVSRESELYRVELSELLCISAPSEKFRFSPSFRHVEKPPLYRDQPVTQVLVEDIQGNAIFYSDGYTLLPGHKLTRIIYTIQPQAGTFPWHPADVIFIGTGMTRPPWLKPG